MTLILGALTREAVVLVSDRRITDGRTGQPFPDEANKTVCLYGQAILGYTGLAQLDGKSTDVWVANLLAGQNPQSAFAVLAKEASRAVRRFPKQHRRHTFVIMGWQPGQSGVLTPFAVLVSNYVNGDGSELAEAADEFRIFSRGLQERAAIVAAPSHLSPRTLLEMKRMVGRYTKDKSSDPSFVADILLNVLFQVADRNPTVGDTAMVACLPRAAVPAELALVGGHWKTELTTLYVSPRSPATQYMPIIVFANGVTMWDAEIKFSRGDDPD